MSARHLDDYWDLNGADLASCDCGWSGQVGSERRMFRDVIDVPCPACDRPIVIMPYPTTAQTRRAAEAGNTAAIAAMEQEHERSERYRRWKSHRLTTPDQLPEIDGSERFVVAWDFESEADEHWQVLRVGDIELWRELAFWESEGRFRQVFDLLVERYGARLADVEPTKASELYLSGDDLRAAERLDALRATLAQHAGA